MLLSADVTSDLFLAAKVQALLGQGGSAVRRVALSDLGALDPPPAAVVRDLGLPVDVREEVTHLVREVGRALGGGAP